MATTLPAQKVIYNLGPVSRIPLGEGRTFQLEEAAVAIFHTRSGQVFATQATCPHRGGPLSDGLIGANKVICPLHAWRFDLKNGQAEGQSCEHLATYPVTLSSTGEILLHLCEGIS
jgi:nitrite reductase (NADH) small subunit